jgi:hypothetical protein
MISPREFSLVGEGPFIGKHELLEVKRYPKPTNAGRNLQQTAAAVK